MNFLSWRVEKTFLKVARKKQEKKRLISQCPKQSENKTKPWVQQKRKPAETENKPRESICNLFHKQASCYRCVSLKSFPNPLISWKKRAKDLKRKLTRKEMQLISISGLQNRENIVLLFQPPSCGHLLKQHSEANTRTIKRSF